LEILFKVGFNPNMPQKAAGIRMLPPISLLRAKFTHPVATRPALPPLDPPQVLVSSNGFFVCPNI
jgi:hypothetical protein